MLLMLVLGSHLSGDISHHPMGVVTRLSACNVGTGWPQSRRKNSLSFPDFSRAKITLFQRLSQQKVYAVITFIYQGLFHINYYSFDYQEPVGQYCSNQQFSCNRYTWLHMDCLTQAAPRVQSQFSLRLHRIPREFHEVFMFREIPEYSTFVTTPLVPCG